MCLAVYLASDTPIAAVAWNEDAPAFYIEPVAENEVVRKRFSLPFVYYAGSHEGCGCGFSKDGEIGPDLERCQKNYIALGQTLREALSHGAKVELFTCWEGEQSCAAKFVATTTPSQLEAPSFELRQLELFHVHSADA